MKQKVPFVRFVCGCQAVVWLPLLNLNLDFLVRSSDRNDRLVSSGFWSKMCDVSVKSLTMVSLMVCGCVFDFGCHQCEFDFSQVSPKRCICLIYCHWKREFECMFVAWVRDLLYVGM